MDMSLVNVMAINHRRFTSDDGSTTGMSSAGNDSLNVYNLNLCIVFFPMIQYDRLMFCRIFFNF